MDLAKLTRQDFEKHLGTVFALQNEEEAVELTLVEVTEHANWTTEAVGADGQPISTREPFSLAFQGPKEPLCQDDLYTLTHAEMGELTVFVKPYLEGPEGYLYEAVFN